MADAVKHADHGHEHPPHLAHHFDTPKQQFESGKLGMWLFLATEVLFFSGLFVFYAVIRRLHPELFAEGSKYLDPTLGAINTAVLIASSLTMALGVWCAQTSRKTGLIICLILTIGGAFGFMGIKYIEYSHKIHLGINWGQSFRYFAHETTTQAPDAKLDVVARPAGMTVEAFEASVGKGSLSTIAAPGRSPAGLSSAALAGNLNPDAHHTPHGKPAVQDHHEGAPAGDSHAAEGGHGHDPEKVNPNEIKNLHLYFSVYYCLTGLHGIHVLAGIVALTWVLIGALKGRFSAAYFTPVDLVGLYWHLVDLVWIFLFPLLYLI